MVTSAGSGSKVALVTGASSGIGAAAVRSLIRDGHTVYGAARNVHGMTDLQAAGARVLAMDVTRPAQVESGVAQIVTEHGGVDVLVNNAGFGSYGAVEDVPLDDARYQFEVNLFGVAALTQAVLPRMRERGWGRIINISSMGGRIYTPLGAWYHASKHAIEGWSDCLRLELEPFGIDVVIVEPGIILTGFGDTMLEMLRERSMNGAYAKQARKLEKATLESYKNVGSPPSVVGDAVAKAARAGRPRTRYVVGKFARPLLMARKLLSDRMFDRLIRRAM